MLDEDRLAGRGREGEAGGRCGDIEGHVEVLRDDRQLQGPYFVRCVAVPRNSVCSCMAIFENRHTGYVLERKVLCIGDFIEVKRET